MDAAAADFSSLPIETVIAGRYETMRCLGMGSMSVVYLCRRISDGKLCALKILSALHSRDSGSVVRTRFRISARIAQCIRHPNVVATYDFLDEPNLIGCVSEYVDGGDLAARLRSQKQLACPEAVRILLQVCEGLEAIHRAGIIHRDIKPANILLSREGNVKVADFGVALSASSPRLTARGSVAGTIDYLSPEQLRGEEVTEQSDIYALGTMAYEMLAGRLPFAAESVFSLVDQKIKVEAPLLPLSDAECPKVIRDAVAKALHREPEKRFQSVGEFAHALRQALVRPEEAQKPDFRVSRSAGLAATGILAALLVVRSFSLTANQKPIGAADEAAPGQVSSAAPTDELDLSDERTASLKREESPAEIATLSESSRESVRLAAKQTMLYRLSDYIAWPAGTFESSGMPLRFCIVGADPFGLSFDKALSGARTSDGRSFWLQRFDAAVSPEKITECQVAYFSHVPRERERAILGAIQSAPVLTITQGGGEGIVDFSPDDSSLNFAIDNEKAKGAHLAVGRILEQMARQSQDNE
jgi:serine/threonine protein kinase